MATRVRVVLADSQPLFRFALSALIERTGIYEVVGQASDGEEALVRIESLAPDLVILESSLPRVAGVGVVQRAKRSGSRARFLFLFHRDRREDLEEALTVEADGYIAKSASPDDLFMAIERALSKQIYLSSSLTGHLIEMARGVSQSGGTQLSGREREILRLIAEGLSSKEIAASLGLSTRTIESHRTAVMGKLGIHKVSGLVRYAIREGLVDP